MLASQQDRVITVVGIDDLIAGPRQAMNKHGKNQPVVIDDEDLSLGDHQSIIRLRHEPSPSRGAV
jgi:hypothetical protein